MGTRTGAAQRPGRDLFLESAIAMANARTNVLRSVEARLAARDLQLQSAARRSRMKSERRASSGRPGEVIDLTALRVARLVRSRRYHDANS